VSALYVVVCRLLELIVLFGAATDPRSWRFSCSATSCRFFAARSTGHALSFTTGCCSRRSTGCCRAAPGTPSPCGRRRCCTGTAGSWPGAGPTRTARAGRRSAVTCASWSCGSRARTRTGLPSDRRRTAQARRRHLGDVRPQHPRERWVGARSEARLAVVAQLPAGAWRVDPRLRFLHRRHCLAATPLRARLHLDRQPPDRVRRLHQQPEHRLDAAAGAQPPDGTRRPRSARSIPDPRSRRKVPARVRRPPSDRKHQGHPHPGAGAERERADGALGRNGPPRMPRPTTDLRPPPARIRPPRLHQAPTTTSDPTADST
jgi:hypothetical protein